MSKIDAVVALGFFDGVHKGHKQVLSLAKSLAKKLGCTAAAFTFSGNLRGKLSGGKCILSDAEKLSVLNNFGFTEIISAPITDEFLSKSPEEFLKYVGGVYNVKGYVCGSDYRFGKNGAGDVNFLSEYCKNEGLTLSVTKTLNENGEKISSSKIKTLLASGEIKCANALLGYDYFITGSVFADRKVGGKMGFPTANFKADADKCELKNGVYAGYSFVNGEKYVAIINYGSRPTFNLNDKLIETHLIGFSGNLYGKQITVCFTDFIRDIKKFNGEDDLKAQLVLDKKFAQEKVK
ncbi:MAG: riboflavin biosynthesis protein RibF [Clostridia bacterium]|nr:riboflavin biosynthesis protein RibF [Clostridia bacterium]